MVSNATGQVNHLQFQVKTIVLLVISCMISVHKMDCISLKCAIFVGGRGSAPDPAGGLTAPPRPPAGLAGPVAFCKQHPGNIIKNIDIGVLVNSKKYILDNCIIIM